MSSDIDKPLQSLEQMKFSQTQWDPVIKQLIGDLICVRVLFLNLKSLLNSQQTQKYTKIIYSLIENVFTRYGYRKFS